MALTIRSLGEGCSILEGAVVGETARLGPGYHVGPGCGVGTGAGLGPGVMLLDRTWLPGTATPAMVGAGAKVGGGTDSILPGPESIAMTVLPLLGVLPPLPRKKRQLVGLHRINGAFRQS